MSKPQVADQPSGTDVFQYGCQRLQRRQKHQIIAPALFAGTNNDAAKFIDTGFTRYHNRSFRLQQDESFDANFRQLFHHPSQTVGFRRGGDHCQADRRRLRRLSTTVHSAEHFSSTAAGDGGVSFCATSVKERNTIPDLQSQDMEHMMRFGVFNDNIVRLQ